MKKVLILGGTGRLGQMLVQRLMDCEVTTLSRSAVDSPRHIQAEVREFSDYAGFDTVIHCAAMKNVAQCEENVEECIAVNVEGTAFALRMAAAAGVERFIYISTDMAVEPQSVYGTSKKLADALVIDAAKNRKIKTAVIRLGNIIAKEGSVFSLFAHRAKESGFIPITDPAMTRFMMSAEDCADFVIEISAKDDLTGEVYAPVCKSYRITDVAQAVAPGVETKVVGLRPGDVLWVTMLSSNELLRTVCSDNYYKIYPVWARIPEEVILCGLNQPLTSANNPLVATIEELSQFID